MPSQLKMNSVVFGEVAFFLNLTGFWLIQCYVFKGFHLNLYVFLILFFLGSFFLFVLSLVCLFCFWFLDACLFFKEGEKERMWVWVDGDVARVWEEYEKPSIFN